MEWNRVHHGFCKQPLLVPRTKKYRTEKRREQKRILQATAAAQRRRKAKEETRSGAATAIHPRAGREDETAAGTGMAAHTGRGEKKILGDIHREKGTEGGREIPMVDMAAKRPRSQQQERQAAQSCSPTRQEHECLPSPPSSSSCWLLLPLSHGVTVVFVCSGGRK